MWFRPPELTIVNGVFAEEVGTVGSKIPSFAAMPFAGLGSEGWLASWA